jgi:hypothetical protein
MFAIDQILTRRHCVRLFVSVCLCVCVCLFRLSDKALCPCLFVCVIRLSATDGKYSAETLETQLKSIQTCYNKRSATVLCLSVRAAAARPEILSNFGG